MLSAPASETFGRLIVYRVSLPISLLFTLGAGFSRTFYSLMICRFFAGFAGSPVLAVGAGTNADLFPPKYRAVATSSFLLAPFLGPSLGPFLGGWVAQYKDWRWTQWTSLFIGLGVYIISLPMKETYKKVDRLLLASPLLFLANANVNRSRQSSNNAPNASESNHHICLVPDPAGRQFSSW